MEPDGLADVSDDEIEAALPNRPVVTLRDIEVVYGTLYALATAGSGEYASYLSPDAASDLLPDQQGLLEVRVDLTGEDPRLGDDPVQTAAYTDEMISRVAHAKYQSARGVDHSLTHETGQSNDAEKHADHAVDRFTRWPTEDAVASVSESHPDGSLIDALRRLGNDEATMERLHDAVVESGRVPEPRHSLVTVVFRIDDERLDTIETTDAFLADAEWHYPGEFAVFQEAMAARKTAKFAAKNDASNAVGGGTCYVFDTDEQVYGVVDDPMKSYLSKQAERFPRFDADESWRTQGLSRDAAVAAQNATTFLDACQYAGPGVSVYTLPHFVDKMDASDARNLFTLLARQTATGINEADNPVAAVAGTRREQQELYAFEQDSSASGLDGDRLRFYVQVVHKYQKDRWRLLAAQPDTAYRTVRELGGSHYRLLQDDRWLGENGAFRTPEAFDFLNPSGVERAVGLVAGPQYFVETCLGEDTDDPSSDDFRFRATADVLADRAISTDGLLAEYIRRIAAEYDPDDEYPFPGATVTEQYVQLRVLAERGLLDHTRTDISYMSTPETDGATSSPDELDRQEKFERFLEDHDRLDHPGRRGVFALGALVGRVTRYQRRKDKSTTAVNNHPVSGLTLANLDRVTTEVVETTVIYSDEEGYDTTMYGELLQAVSDHLQTSDPTDWGLSTQDVRYHYAMGIAYGLSDQSTSGQETDHD